MRIEERVDDAIDAIYAAATSPGLWPYALHAIANVFGDAGTLLVYQREDGAFSHICSPGLESISKEFSTEYQGEDLRAVRALQRGLYFDRNVLTDRDLVSADEMEKHPFYLLLAKYGLRHHAAVTICPNKSLATSVAVQRSMHLEEYEAEELATLERLCRHVENSLRVSIRLLSAELTREGLAECLSRVAVAVFGLDANGRVVFMNGLAKKLQDELPVRRDNHLSPSSFAGKLVREAIEAVLKEAGHFRKAECKPVVWASPGTGRRYAAYILPTTHAIPGAESYFTALRYMLVVRTYDPCEALDASLVRDLFNLTLGEARLASLVGAGTAPGSAARRLGISEQTARTVLKRVFAKMGVTRQSEMASLMTRLVL